MNLDDGTKWDDVELMDCKDIFIKMMDWIRNYDTSNEEFTRKIRFTSHDGVNDLARRILEIGDLKMQENNPKESEDFQSRNTGLSRSKSDHRLVSEFRRQEESGNSSPPVRRRAFGEQRYGLDKSKSRSNISRYGGEEEDEEGTGRSSRFRSRFLRGDEEEETDRRNSRNIEEEQIPKKERNKVIETEDASRGPLSGCIRLADSSRVIQRLKEREMELLRPKKKDTPPPAPKPAAPRPAPPPTRPKAQDDDEIDRIKQENKAKDAAAASATATAPQPPATPATTATTPLTHAAPATPT